MARRKKEKIANYKPTNNNNEIDEKMALLRQGYFVQFYTKLDAHDYFENFNKPNRFKVWLYGIRVWFEWLFHKLMRKH